MPESTLFYQAIGTLVLTGKNFAIPRGKTSEHEQSI